MHGSVSPDNNSRYTTEGNKKTSQINSMTSGGPRKSQLNQSNIASRQRIQNFGSADKR